MIQLHRLRIYLIGRQFSNGSCTLVEKYFNSNRDLAQYVTDYCTQVWQSLQFPVPLPENPDEIRTQFTKYFAGLINFNIDTPTLAPLDSFGCLFLLRIDRGDDEDSLIRIFTSEKTAHEHLESFCRFHWPKDSTDAGYLNEEQLVRNFFERIQIRWSYSIEQVKVEPEKYK